MLIMISHSFISTRKRDELIKGRSILGALARWDSWAILLKSLPKCQKIERDTLISPSHMKLKACQ